MEKVMFEKAEDESKNFLCTSCKRIFVTAMGLKKHAKIHNPTQFICKFCNQSFTSKSNYSKHFKYCEERKTYSCSSCENSFAHAGDLLHHLRTCSREEPNLYCNICNQQYNDEIFFNLHMKGHSRNPYKCSICPCIFNSQNNLDRHMKFHFLKMAQLSCTSYEKDSSTKGNLKKHRRIHAGNALVCTVCKIAFSNIRKFENHVKSHSYEPTHNSVPSECASSNTAGVDLFKCGICDLAAYNLEDLSSHISASHTIINNQNSALVLQGSTDLFIHVNKLFFMCDVCEKYICVKDSTDLESHKKSHSDLNKTHINNSSFDQTIAKSENMAANDVLDSTNSSLVSERVITTSNYSDAVKMELTHVKNNSSNGETVAENSCFTSKSNEKNFAPFIKSEESFICDICHTYFSTLKDRKAHEESHSKQLIPFQDSEIAQKSEQVDLGIIKNEFTCDICKDNFISLEHLEKHSKIHIEKISIMFSTGNVN